MSTVFVVMIETKEGRSVLGVCPREVDANSAARAARRPPRKQRGKPRQRRIVKAAWYEPHRVGPQPGVDAA